MPGKTSVYWKSLRPFAFGGSLLPLALGSFYALGKDSFSWPLFFFSLSGVWLIHAAGNLANDYYDYRFNLDSPYNRGKNNPLVTQKLTPGYYKIMITVFFLSAFVIGFYLRKPGCFLLPVLGLTGAFFAFFYTAPPLSFKYRGWGTPIIFLVFGPFLTGGGYLVQTGEISYLPFLLGIFPGFHMTAVLLTNELMDYNSDKERQIITTAIKLGRENSKIVLSVLLGFPFLLVIVFVLINLLPLRSLMVIVTFPAVLNLYSKAGNNTSADSKLDIKAAKFQMLFTSALTLTLL